MKNLKVLINTNCELMVSPRTDILDPGYVYMEFVTGDGVNSLETSMISENPQLFRYAFKRDGVYMYYRLKLTTKSLLDDLDITDRLYFDDVTEKLMIGNIELKTNEQLFDIIDSDYPESKYGIIEFIEKPIFSICRLSACLENMQRKYIFSECPNVSKSKCIDDSEKLLRDFLFSGIFILRSLIRQQRYEEALKVLESINRCDICGNTYTASKTKCGCCN